MVVCYHTRLYLSMLFFTFLINFFFFAGLLLVVLCKNIYLYMIFSLFKKSGIREIVEMDFFLCYSKVVIHSDIII